MNVKSIGLVPVVALLAVMAGATPSLAATRVAGVHSSLEAAASSAITIGGIGDLTGVASSPQPTQGLQAYAKFVNAHGGIDGHTLKIVSCDGGEDPNKFAACAHSFVANPAVIASADLGGAYFAQSDAILAAAKIGVVDSDPVGPTEFDAPNSVSATGGVPTSFGAIIKYFATVKHVKSIAFLSINGVGTQLEAIAENFAKPYGIKVTPFLFPETTIDYTATATAAAASGAGLVLGATGVNAVGPLLVALKAAGNTIPVSFFDTSITPQAISEAGAAANGLYTTSAFPTLAIATGASKTALKDYDVAMAGGGVKPGTGTLQGWACGLMLTTIIEKLGVAHATRAAILKVIEHGQIVGAPLFPSLMSKATTAPKVSSFSSLINPFEYIGQYQNGVFAALPGVSRINPYAA